VLADSLVCLPREDDKEGAEGKHEQRLKQSTIFFFGPSRSRTVKHLDFCDVPGAISILRVYAFSIKERIPGVCAGEPN
jgi:hypothetical protein